MKLQSGRQQHDNWFTEFLQACDPKPMLDNYRRRKTQSDVNRASGRAQLHRIPFIWTDPGIPLSEPSAVARQNPNTVAGLT